MHQLLGSLSTVPVSPCAITQGIAIINDVRRDQDQGLSYYPSRRLGPQRMKWSGLDQQSHLVIW